MTRDTRPRGIRNNNPGNIRVGAPWEGLQQDREAMTPEQRAETEFCVFETPAYGIRAIARVLITYQDRRRARDGSRIDTVREIIERWAPPSENNTDAYVRRVREALGLETGAPINVKGYATMRALVEAIIHHECRYNPYTSAQIDKGLVLAGISPPATGKVGQGRTMTAAKGGAALLAGGTAAKAAADVAGGLGDAAAELAPAMPFLHLLGGLLPYVVAAGLLIVLGRIAWARLDDHRRGLR